MNLTTLDQRFLLSEIHRQLKSDSKLRPSGNGDEITHKSSSRLSQSISYWNNQSHN